MDQIYQIEPMTTSDLPAAYELDESRLASHWSYPFFTDRYLTTPELWLCAREGAQGEPVGFICGRLTDSGRVMGSRLAVRKDLEGRGIGTALVREFVRIAHTMAPTIEFTARRNNLRAMHIYKDKIGFRPESKHEFTDGDAGEILILPQQKVK